MVILNTRLFLNVFRCVGQLKHDVRRADRPIEHMNTAALSWSAHGNQLAVVADQVDRRPPALRFATPGANGASAIAMRLDAPEPQWVVRDPKTGEIDWAAMPAEVGLTPPSGPGNAPVPPDNAAKAIVLLPQQAPLYGAARLASQVCVCFFSLRVVAVLVVFFWLTRATVNARAWCMFCRRAVIRATQAPVQRFQSSSFGTSPSTTASMLSSDRASRLRCRRTRRLPTCADSMRTSRCTFISDRWRAFGA